MKPIPWIVLGAIALISIAFVGMGMESSKKSKEISGLRAQVADLTHQLESTSDARKAGQVEIDERQKVLEGFLHQEKSSQIQKRETEKIISQLTQENKNLKTQLADISNQLGTEKDNMARIKGMALQQDEEMNRLRAALVAVQQLVEENKNVAEQDTVIAAYNSIRDMEKEEAKQKSKTPSSWKTNLKR